MKPIEIVDAPVPPRRQKSVERLKAMHAVRGKPKAIVVEGFTKEYFRIAKANGWKVRTQKQNGGATWLWVF